MKAPLVAALVVVLLAGVAGGVYLLLHSPSTSSTSSQSANSTSSTTLQVRGAPAHVTVTYVACSSDTGTCVVSLANSGGSVEATGCTISGLPGVFSPKSSSVPPGGLVNVSCSPSNGNATSIPGFHVEGSIQLSDGTSVQFTGSWQ